MSINVSLNFLRHQGVKTTVPYSFYFSFYTYQRHLLRDRQRDTTACQACWATVSGEEKNILYWSSQDKTKISCTGTRNPTKEEPLSFVLLESPFASVSRISKGHPPIIFMIITSFTHFLYQFTRNTNPHSTTCFFFRVRR